MGRNSDESVTSTRIRPIVVADCFPGTGLGRLSLNVRERLVGVAERDRARHVCERAKFGSAGLAGLAVTPVEREEITRRGWRRAKWWGVEDRREEGPKGQHEWTINRYIVTCCCQVSTFSCIFSGYSSRKNLNPPFRTTSGLYSRGLLITGLNLPVYFPRAFFLWTTSSERDFLSSPSPRFCFVW